MQEFDNTFDNERMQEIRREEEESLIKTLAAQAGYQYVNLRGITINPDALSLLPIEQARAAELVLFEKHRDRLGIAIHNPNNPKTKAVLEDLRSKKYTLNVFMTSMYSLEHGWKRYADQRNTTAVKRGVLDIDTDNIAKMMKNLKAPEQVADSITEIRTVNSARRISETLEVTFAGALGLGASDIHIEPEETGIRMRYRLDGVLYDIIDLERDIYIRLISRLKLLSGMILNVRVEAQDGRFTFAIGEREVEVRSSIIPGASGESMVMRLLDPSVASFNMESLGLNDTMHTIMSEELKRPNGLIVTTGPTGSGKTTALYAFLRQTHKPGVKIITIENPVEYKIDNIVQTQVEGEYTFASGLRAVLRQDPDIIMVGEIRDRDVAETAIHASQTGHLVFSTLHTNSAVGAFTRLLDLGIDYRVFGTAVNIILGQRLVRRLCEQCKTKREANEKETRTIHHIHKGHPTPPPLTNPLYIYEASGCTTCNHTGFSGRQGIFEAIRIDQAVEEALLRDPREHIILAAAKAQGIPTMAEDGIEKVLHGITSLAELERVVDLQTDYHDTKTAEDTPDDDFSNHIV